MNQESSTFENYPIEFKEINPEDFTLEYNIDGTTTSRGVFSIDNNGEKIVIEPNENGYINDEIQHNIDLEIKNTVVINAAVGQGKSYSIIQTIKRYFEDKSEQKYIVIVASPFVSLVKQYVEDINSDGGIPEELIFDYNKLGKQPPEDFLNKFVHVVTVNTLLGNPGEEGFKNSDVKRDYLDTLSSYSKQNNIKVVFVYDEIHDSYHNFKQKYIFSLWKWREVIHKNIIISATFNEASKIVIEYLAELTDKRIKIIESKRVRFPEKQSELFLYYSDEYNFTAETELIESTILSLVESGKKIDILCYSKSLSKEIVKAKTKLGKKLIGVYGRDGVKDCTSKLIDNSREENVEPTNQYDENMCNVGTNFKTGVSIRKDNHAYVIIMPPRSTRLSFKNQYGIFSGGTNSVVQAIARQRRKGEIHIILPKPNHFNFDSLSNSDMTEAQKEEFKAMYESLEYSDKSEKKVSYIKLQSQIYLIKKFYNNKLKRYLSPEITLINQIDREGLNELNFQKTESFILEDGEDYLASEFELFGGDISAFISYAAIANQFVNCSLKKIFVKEDLLFKEEVLDNQLRRLNEDLSYRERHALFQDYSTFERYQKEFKNTLYKEYNIKFKRIGQEGYNFNSHSKKVFEKKLLNWLNASYHNQKIEDFSRADYIWNCVRGAKESDIDSVDSIEIKSRMLLFRALGHFIDKIFSLVNLYDSRGRKFYYVETKFDNIRFTEEDVKFLSLIEEYVNSDFYLSKVFNFNRDFKDASVENKFYRILKILKKDFLLLDSIKNKSRILINQRRTSVTKVLGYYLPNNREIDFFNNDIDWDKLEEERIDSFGLENYNKLLEGLFLNEEE